MYCYLQILFFAEVALRLSCCNQQDRIHRHNVNAWRHDDLINLSEKSRKKRRGHGSYRKLLPNAILRLSFGMRLFQGSTFGSTATKPDKLTNPSAAASRTLATFCGVSHSHVQVCRNAVAESVAKRIIEAVREETHLGMLRLKLLVIQFAFDEAEMDVRVGRSSDVRHVFMSHVRLFLRRNDDQTKLLEIPVATAIIDSTAAENLCEFCISGSDGSSGWWLPGWCSFRIQIGLLQMCALPDISRRPCRGRTHLSYLTIA